MLLLKTILFFFVVSVSLLAYPNVSQVVKDKKFYPMGEKIYKKKCQKIDPKKYSTYGVLYNAVLNDKICSSISKKYAQAVSLYLWDTQRGVKKYTHYKKILVSKEDKCPVCGMFLYKYPQWIARIEYKDTNVSFDGIKDMMKYYFEHPESIKNLLVQEYYTQEVINAKKAYFVIGSDIYGPMGNELIAFKDEASAKQFYFDHNAKKILKFDEIKPDDVYQLDE